MHIVDENFADGVLQVKLFTVLRLKGSVKIMVFITFLSFRRNQKQEFNFQQVGRLVTRNISIFCLQQVPLYLKDISNSIDFYKRIFLYVVPAQIIVPWLIWLISRCLFNFVFNFSTVLTLGICFQPYYFS